jgi:hypothetical protein
MAASDVGDQVKVIMRHCRAAVDEALGFEEKKKRVAGKVVVERVPLANDGGMGMPILTLPPNDADIYQIYVLLIGLYGPNGEFVGGEFLVKMTLPKKEKGAAGYPYNPPIFSFMTPNGVYELNAKSPCVSIGVFHQNEMRGSGGYSAGLKLTGFIENIWGTFVDPKSLGHGIAIMKFNSETCRSMAQTSREYNRKHHAELMKQFDALYKLDERHKHWELQQNVPPAAEKTPAAEKDPAAEKELAAEKDPAAEKKPTAKKKPAAGKKPAAEKAPAAEKEPAAEKKPAAETTV